MNDRHQRRYDAAKRTQPFGSGAPSNAPQKCDSKATSAIR